MTFPFVDGLSNDKLIPLLSLLMAFLLFTKVVVLA